MKYSKLKYLMASGVLLALLSGCAGGGDGPSPLPTAQPNIDPKGSMQAKRLLDIQIGLELYENKLKKIASCQQSREDADCENLFQEANEIL